MEHVSAPPVTEHEVLLTLFDLGRRVTSVLLGASSVGPFLPRLVTGQDAAPIKRYVVPGSTDQDPTYDKWVTAECPEGTTEKGTVCEIEAPLASPIVEDLTLEPVEGKEGYLLKGGVFIGEDNFYPDPFPDQ